MPKRATAEASRQAAWQLQHRVGYARFVGCGKGLQALPFSQTCQPPVLHQRLGGNSHCPCFATAPALRFGCRQVQVAPFMLCLGSLSEAPRPSASLLLDTPPHLASGAFNLDGGMLHGRTLLNLDTEDWGDVFIGCAGAGQAGGAEWGGERCRRAMRGRGLVGAQAACALQSARCSERFAKLMPGAALIGCLLPCSALQAAVTAC